MKKNTILSLIFGAFLMVSCSIPNAIEPKFEKNNQEVLKELQSIGNFEKVAVNGSAFSHGSENTDFLVIQLINGKDINGEKDQMQQIGKQAMKFVINSIKNENDYDKFQVVFIQQAKKGLITTSFTIPIEYNLSDLK